MRDCPACGRAMKANLAVYRGILMHVRCVGSAAAKRLAVAELVEQRARLERQVVQLGVKISEVLDQAQAAERAEREAL